MSHQSISLLQGLSTEALVKEYEKLASIRGAALENNDASSANRAFDTELSIRRELRTRNPGISSLLPLLESPNPWVRLDSAVPILFVAPQKAEPVLNELKNYRGMLATIAHFTLQKWNKGTLKAL